MNKTSSHPETLCGLPKVMQRAAALCFALAAAAALCYRHGGGGVFLSLAVTFGTVFYHLAVRLLAGALFQRGMQNRADYTKTWYRLRPWESRLYRFLRVKQWKGRLPTYRPESFSPKAHPYHEIAQAMCQAELVHEANILLSFVPVFAVRWFGAPGVFWGTSVCAALFDLLFVMVQRYNRARVVKLAQRESAAAAAADRNC